MVFSLILIIKVRELKEDGSLHFCIWNVFIFVSIRVPPLKKNTDYGSELLIPKNPKQSLLFSVGINISKQDFFILWLKLQFLL